VSAAGGNDAVRELVHELRSPLAIVDGFAGLLARDGETLPPEKRIEYAQRIADAAAEMRALLDAAAR
jgi:signal transduction histidine kinase